jgi:hypothetical protein
MIKTSLAHECSIERNGTGVERNGTGIERNGTGVERNGTGVERNGSGIRRFGSALAFALVVLSATALGTAVPTPALAGASGTSGSSAPATLLVRGRHVSLQIGGAECSLSGTGFQRAGYARFPLTFTMHDRFDPIRVHGSGSGAPNPGGGDGDDDEGTNAAGPGCAALLRQFPLDDAFHGASAATPSRIWGEAEIALDGLKPAAVLIHVLDRNGTARNARPLEVSVVVQ